MAFVTRDKEQRALDAIASGETLTGVLQSLGISPYHWHQHIQDAEAFSRYARARIQQAHAMADMAVEAARAEADVQRAKLLSDVYKWRASKGAPADYGDRLDVSINGRVDIGATLLEARNRARPVSDQRDIIDAQVIETKGLEDMRATDTQSVEDADAVTKSLDDSVDSLLKSIT